MSKRIDVFAHVLPPKFYRAMLNIDVEIPKRFSFIEIDVLTNITVRRQNFDGITKQVISAVNINPEDFVGAKEAATLCRQANQEISTLVDNYPEMFAAGIAMVPMNNIPAAVDIIRHLPTNLVGIQLFTRALGKSIADPQFNRIWQAAAEKGILVLLHPVFDPRKPDNNLVFSCEYELSQAMLQLVTAKLFQKYPHLKVIVHHAGAMVPLLCWTTYSYSSGQSGS